MIAPTQRVQTNRRSPTEPRRVLLLGDDPLLESLVAAVCERHQWCLTVSRDECAALPPARRLRPKFLLFGFSLSDEDSLQFLLDLHAVYPHAPLGIITGDSPDDIADVVGLAGGTAVVVKPSPVADLSALF